MTHDSDSAKVAVGKAVAACIESGMRVGLGTGSTAALAIEELGRRVREEGLHIVGVPTSFSAERKARDAGIPLGTLDDVTKLDLAFDGADEVDPAFRLIKGRGGAHSREKVIAWLAQRFVVLVDESKQVQRLGTRKPLPVEVMPMAVAPVMRAITDLGGFPELRMGQRKDGPVVTDQSLWIVDVHFKDGIHDPEHLDQVLLALPGVLDHGLFLDQTTDVFIGRSDGTVNHLQKETPSVHAK